jgi:hypothetical protein
MLLESWIFICRRLKLDPFHLLPKSTQAGSKTLIQGLKLETTPGSSRKYTGTYRYRELLPK